MSLHFMICTKPYCFNKKTGWCVAKAQEKGYDFPDPYYGIYEKEKLAMGPHLDYYARLYRLNRATRWCVVKAQEKAREMRLPFIDSDHLLYGLVLVKVKHIEIVLSHHGITADAIEALIEQKTPIFPIDSGSDDLPFSTNARKVFANGSQEALLSNLFPSVQPGHLMVAMLNDSPNESAAVRILISLGINIKSFRAELLPACR